jgi:glycosyltransferase involved in cell wall biosynthesis
MTQPLISICLPTCNQPTSLETTLTSFIDQDNTDIEILIRDDSQQDISNYIVSKYKDLPIQYFKMEKGGIDLAILWLLNKSKGKYVWIFGDDILEKKSIQNVKKIIKSYNPSLIYLNSFCIENNNVSINHHNYIGSDKNFFLNLIKDQMGFCSALVMKSEKIQECLPASNKFIGSCWLTLFLSLGVLNNSQKLIYDNRLFFKSHFKPPGESRWYDSYLVHCIYYSKVLNYYKFKFNSQLIIKLINIKYLNSVKAVLSERGKNLTTGYASRGNKIFVTLHEFWYNFRTYPILFFLSLPNFLIVFLYKSYKKMVGFKSNLNLLNRFQK